MGIKGELNTSISYAGAGGRIKGNMEPEETQIVEASNGDRLLDKAVSSLAVPFCLVYRRWRADILRGENNCCRSPGKMR